ncbi:MAG: 50S ribosomal protein L10 [Sphingobacteriia bacterium]|nr:50S ribosomal protein L10 [Sphingobacteriia bacterium]
MRKNEKINLVASVNEEFKKNTMAVAFYYHGLTVADLTELRKRVGSSQGKMKVIKNRLTKLAIKETSFECMDPVLKGPTAIAYSNEPAFVKEIVNFAKDKESLKIVGGVLNGKLVDEASVKVIATLPSLDELRAKILGIIQTPASRVAGAINEVPSKVARVLKTYASKND